MKLKRKRIKTKPVSQYNSKKGKVKKQKGVS